MPRRVTGMNLAEIVSKQEVVLDKDPGDMMRVHMAQDGARAAGWLVGANRKRFVRSGKVDFTIPDDQETPPWMRVALEFLKTRKKWHVLTFRQGGANDSPRTRTYRVTWKRWKGRRRADG